MKFYYKYHAHAAITVRFRIAMDSKPNMGVVLPVKRRSDLVFSRTTRDFRGDFDILFNIKISCWGVNPAAVGLKCWKDRFLQRTYMCSIQIHFEQFFPDLWVFDFKRMLETPKRLSRTEKLQGPLRRNLCLEFCHFNLECALLNCSSPLQFGAWGFFIHYKNPVSLT